VCEVLGRLRLERTNLEVIQFTDHLSIRHRIPSLGLLNSEQLKPHRDSVQLTSLEREVLREAWAGATDVTPELLVNLLSRQDQSLPTLRGALAQTIWRYPDSRTGLSRWDSRLLANLRDHGPRAIVALAETLCAPGWDDDPVGDRWLFWRARRFADQFLAHPLVRLHGSVSDYRAATVEVTPAGDAVLAGSANALDLNGIDDWVGGVHLSSKEQRVWVCENGNLVRRSG